MTAIDHTRRLSPVAYSLDGQVSETVFNPAYVTSSELLELAEMMRPHGDKKLTDAVEKIWRTSEAITAAAVLITNGEGYGDTLLDDDPEALTRRIVANATRTVVHASGHYDTALNAAEAALVRAARTALKPAVDGVVKRLRKDFDTHAAVIKRAATVGLSQHTDRDDLLTTGTEDQIAAYRDLAGAEAGLEQIAGLRIRMAQLLTYGPWDSPVAAFVTDVATSLDLDSAANIYDGDTEWRQYHQGAMGAAHIRVHSTRLGGRWLALVGAGYTLHLNTADEATAVLTEAVAV